MKYVYLLVIVVVGVVVGEMFLDYGKKSAASYELEQEIKFEKDIEKVIVALYSIRSSQERAYFKHGHYVDNINELDVADSLNLSGLSYFKVVEVGQVNKAVNSKKIKKFGFDKLEISLRLPYSPGTASAELSCSPSPQCNKYISRY